tara:strand:- start:444 stop:1169 length:726 start_codon:yes stop_codon:yes gene_type:complete
MSFSLVIPCYNEAENITILVNKYRKFLKNKNNELVFVNNGSTDNTDNVFKKLKKKYKNIKTCKIKKNIGFGYGLKKGLKMSKKKHVLYSHADLEVDPNDIMKCINIFIKKKNQLSKRIFIKGNRVNKIKNHWSLNDLFFTYGQTIFSSILFIKKLYDIHAQPVFFPRFLLNEIKYFPNDFSIDLALYLHAVKNNYQIIRFPVNFNKKGRLYGNGNSSNLSKKIKGTFEQFYNSFKILFKGF